MHFQVLFTLKSKIFTLQIKIFTSQRVVKATHVTLKSLVVWRSGHLQKVELAYEK